MKNSVSRQGMTGKIGFRFFLAAAAISNCGTWIQMMTVQSLLFDLTRSGSWLGLSTVVTLVPALVLTPFAGVMADRFSRLRILKITQSVQMLAAFALWILYISGNISPLRIIAIGFINGSASGFQTAAWQSFIPLLVDREDVLYAVRLNTLQNTLARAAGPTIGAVILRLGGISSGIFINGVTFMVVIFALLVVRPRAGSTSQVEAGVFRGLIDGARYLQSQPALRLGIAIALVVSSCGQSLQYVTSAIAANLYGHNSNGNAGLLAAMGIGAVLSSILAIVLRERFRRSDQILLSMMLYVVAIIAMATTQTYVVGQVAFFLIGVAQLQVAVTLNTLIQGRVPDYLRGRAMSFYLMGLIGGLAFGSQIIGLAGDTFGYQITLLIDAAVIGATAVVIVTRGLSKILDDN